jgi:hypothetical protein
MAGDSLLVQDKASHFLTSRDSWPTLTVQVKGRPVPCPAILRVPSSSKNKDDGFTLSTEVKQGLASFDDDQMGRMESIWELDLTADRSVFEEDDNAYSEESVLE